MFELNDLNAEQATVGALLLDPSVAIDVCDILQPEAFYSDITRIVYTAIYELYNEGKKYDALIVGMRLEEKGLLSQIGGQKALIDTLENQPSAKNVMMYANKVLSCASLRDLDAQALEMRKVIYDDDLTNEEKINEVTSITANIGIDDEDGEMSFQDMNKDTILHIEQASKTKGLTGITTGFTELDERFHGLQNEALYILAARPSMGKTTLALNIAKNAAKHKHVLIFSMEMGHRELLKKFYSMNGANLNDIQRGNLDCLTTGSDLQAGAYETMNLKMTLDCRSALKPQQIRAKSLKVSKKHDLGLIVIDYLGLMSVNKPQNTVADTTEISKALKALAKELKVPVLALAQLNRDVEKRTDKTPQLSDLRDSGSIEQDADAVIFIYRDEYYAEREERETKFKDVAKIVTAKHRSGQVGDDYLGTKLGNSLFKNLVDYAPPKEDISNSWGGNLYE